MPRAPCPRRAPVALALPLALASPAAAPAQSTWTGNGGDNLWTTAANERARSRQQTPTPVFHFLLERWGSGGILSPKAKQPERRDPTQEPDLD
jgi:hypothetical protein